MTRFDPLAFIRNRFLKDTATLQVSSMLNQASQIVSSIVVAFLLGAHGQGLFVLAIALQGLLYNLLNVGLVQATISQVAAAHARGIREKLTAWLAFLAKAFLIINVGIIAVGALVLPEVAERWYGNRELGWWAWWLCFFPLIDTLRAVVFVALQGTRRMLLVAQLDNSTEIVRAFLVISGTVITGSPAGAVAGEILARVIWAAMAYEFHQVARADDQGWLPTLREIARAVPGIPMRRGIRLGLRVGAIKNTHTLLLRVVPGLVLGGLAGASWVAYFSLAKRLMEVPLMLMQGVTRTALPALSELAGLRDTARFKRLFVRSTLLGGALVTTGIAVFLPLVRPVVGALWPDDYAEPVFRYALILVIGYVPGAFAVALESFYIVTNRMRTSLLLTLAGALLTVPINVWLMVAFPETGAAWGHTVYMSWVLVHLGYVAWFFRRGAREGIWAPAASAEEPASQEA